VVNHQRAREVMQRHQLDGLIATTTENVIYVTDYLGINLPRKSRRSYFLAVLGSDAEGSALICPRVKLSYGAQTDLPGLDVRGFGEARRVVGDRSNLTELDLRLLELEDRSGERERDAFTMLGEVLAERGLDRDVRLGVDEMGLSHDDWERLQRLLPAATIVNGYDIFREIRAIKSPEEVDRLREGLQRTHAALDQVIDSVRAGVAQREVWHALRTALYERGLTPRSLSVGIGPSSAYSFTEPLDYVARPGDFVKFDPNAVWRGYMTDTGRTAVIGEPSPKQRTAFEAVSTGFRTGVAALRPGALCRDVFAEITGATREAGLPHYDPSSLGHSIGLDIYDIPALERDEPATLEAGMVVNVEVPYYELGFGGIQLEDTFLITTSAAEPLSDLSAELRILTP
jgi:Xaa-Pro dipeptidase